MNEADINSKSVQLVTKLVRLTSEGAIHWTLVKDDDFISKCKQDLGNGESLLGYVFTFNLDTFFLRLYKYVGYLSENGSIVPFYTKYRLEFYNSDSLESLGVIPQTNALADLYETVIRSLFHGPVDDFIQELDKVNK